MGKKDQLKRVLNARNGILIFFFLCKIIPDVFFPTTDKAYSNHCLRKMNERLPKICTMEKNSSFREEEVLIVIKAAFTD